MKYDNAISPTWPINNWQSFWREASKNGILLEDAFWSWNIKEPCPLLLDYQTSIVDFLLWQYNVNKREQNAAKRY